MGGPPGGTTRTPTGREEEVPSHRSAAGQARGAEGLVRPEPVRPQVRVESLVFVPRAVGATEA